MVNLVYAGCHKRQTQPPWITIVRVKRHAWHKGHAVLYRKMSWARAGPPQS